MLILLFLPVQALLSTLGIGLLTLLCFVPAVLLAEMWMRHDGERGEQSSRRTI